MDVQTNPCESKSENAPKHNKTADWRCQEDTPVPGLQSNMEIRAPPKTVLTTKHL